MERANEVRHLLFLEDVNTLNIPEDDKDSLRMRIIDGDYFGCAPSNETMYDDYAINIFPFAIAKMFRTEEEIISKLNYTTVHELIHLLGKLDSEELAHGYTMTMCEDRTSNRSGKGFCMLQQKDGFVIEL